MPQRARCAPTESRSPIDIATLSAAGTTRALIRVRDSASRLRIQRHGHCELDRSVSQTRAFTTIFLIEMWERFGFYGMQVLMVTYMMKKLGFVDTRANLVWGAAAALIYATPAIGGWIGDKLIGTRRTMRIGALVLALGYALLWLPSNNEFFLYFALGVIIVGNGLFKPNSGNLVRKIAPYAKILISVTPADTQVTDDAASQVAPPEMMKALETISQQHLANVISISDGTGEITYSRGSAKTSPRTPASWPPRPPRHSGACRDG